MPYFYKTGEYLGNKFKYTSIKLKLSLAEENSKEEENKGKKDTSQNRSKHLKKQNSTSKIDKALSKKKKKTNTSKKKKNFSNPAQILRNRILEAEKKGTILLKYWDIFLTKINPR